MIVILVFGSDTYKLFFRQNLSLIYRPLNDPGP